MSKFVGLLGGVAAAGAVLAEADYGDGLEITAANTEFDPAKRAAHLRTIAQYYHDQAAALLVFDSVDMNAVKNCVRDYQPMNPLINWHEVSVDKN